MAVILETSLGDLTVDLYTDERPRCCKNFLKLCKVKYYNFCLFHSVQRNLVAQSGDPTGTGRGGESVYTQLYGEQAKYFEAELAPRIKHTKRGLVSMVNNGNNMHGSQFFITLADNLDYLDGKHTVFGEVAEGEDVLMKVNEAYCDDEHRPYKDIRIYHTVVLDDPYDDPDGLEIPDRSPEPTQEQLDSVRIGADEEIDDFQGKTEEEVKEFMEEKDAKANAQILEIVGDIPDVDAKPPDNVLFVCKLNPVTTDEDLEIIFSRFGPITSCEVIKDQKSGESLQYAFVEFEKPEDCESAYFKMDNVLIDDRRIHVDFSQSVSKIKWKGKGKGVTKEDEKEEPKPKYAIVDRSTRKDNNYELLFDDDEDKKSKKSKKKKKHKERRKSESDSDSGSKHRRNRDRRSDSDSDGGSRKKKHKEYRRRSRSRSPDYRRRSRSRSPDYRQRRDRSPPAKYSKHRDDHDSKRHSDRDRSRDYGRYDKSRSYDKHRDYEGSKYRERR